MATIPFENTKAGSILYGNTLPRIAKALERIADALELQNKVTEESLKEEKKKSLREKLNNIGDINEQV